LDFEDDNLCADKPRALSLLKGIAGLKLPLSLSAMNGLCYWTLDREILAAMREAGFESINLSLVSTHESMVSQLNRPHSLEKFHNVVWQAVELDLRVTAYAIMGMPGQSLEEMMDTVKALSGSQCLIGPSPFYFTPGSPIHKQLGNSPRIILASKGRDPFFSARLTALDVEHEDFSRDDIYTCFKLCRVINYFKKGLDRGMTLSDPWFKPAYRIIRQGRWHAESKQGKYPLPFSKKIYELLIREPFEVRGHTSGRKMVIGG
jgi:radical SAM superfamily enzyme YgiQ (UPF0313 family)